MSDTYRKILDVAYNLIVKQGYTATSIRQIAEEAGIGKATVYHHFKDKESIAYALLAMRTNEMQDLLNTIGNVQDPVERLKKAAFESMCILMYSAEVFQIIRREIPQSRDKLQNSLVSFFKEYTALLTESLKTGIDAGLFRSIEPEEATKVFLCVLQGTFASVYITGEKPKSPEKMVNSILDIFLNGIMK